MQQLISYRQTTINQELLQNNKNQINYRKRKFCVQINHQSQFITNKMPLSTTNPFSIDQQIGTLLAFIILFEKKIEVLKIKLAGNQEFHSRLAFQLLDKRRKCLLLPEDMYDMINRYSSSKSINQVEGLCHKYTTNGSFSYDDFLKFLIPKTNKILAQRLMIRTYRAGTQLPPYVIQLLFDIFQSSITMLSITQNIRRQIQQNTQLTHIEIIELFKKCCTSKEKLFYFINASTNGQGDYDFTLDQMNYLTFHVRGSCDLEDLDDHQIKEILYPLDMNYQKTFYNTMTAHGFGGQTTNNDMKNRTDYFKTKAALDKIAYQEEKKNRTTVNFLNTNYRQTSKGGFYNSNKQKLESKQLFTQGLQQNVQPKFPAAINSKQSFPTSVQKQLRFNINHQLKPPTSQLPSQQRYSPQLNDISQVSSMINYGNLYIQRFTRGATNNYLGLSRSNQTAVRQHDDYINEKYEGNKKREMFNDSLPRRNEFESSDDISNDSAFMQY